MDTESFSWTEAHSHSSPEENHAFKRPRRENDHRITQILHPSNHGTNTSNNVNIEHSNGSINNNFFNSNSSRNSWNGYNSCTNSRDNSFDDQENTESNAIGSYNQMQRSPRKTVYELMRKITKLQGDLLKVTNEKQDLQQQLQRAATAKKDVAVQTGYADTHSVDDFFINNSVASNAFLVSEKTFFGSLPNYIVFASKVLMSAWLKIPKQSRIFRAFK